MKRRLYFIFLICYVIISCSATEDSCGCSSPTMSFVGNEDNLIGNISYKKKIDGIEEYYTNRFWISVRYSNCVNCIDFYIICNESVLDSSFDILKESDTNKFLEIQFSGELKEVCNKIISPSDVNYSEIILTKIKKL